MKQVTKYFLMAVFTVMGFWVSVVFIGLLLEAFSTKITESARKEARYKLERSEEFGVSNMVERICGKDYNTLNYEASAPIETTVSDGKGNIIIESNPNWDGTGTFECRKINYNDFI